MFEEGEEKRSNEEANHCLYKAALDIEKQNESSCFVEFCMIPVLSYTALKWVLGKKI